MFFLEQWVKLKGTSKMSTQLSFQLVSQVGYLVPPLPSGCLLLLCCRCVFLSLQEFDWQPLSPRLDSSKSLQLLCENVFVSPPLFGDVSVECRILGLLSVFRVSEIYYCSVSCSSDEIPLFPTVCFILTIWKFFSLYLIFSRSIIKCFVYFFLSRLFICQMFKELLWSVDKWMLLLHFGNADLLHY